jgi:hypothetical protein
MGEVLLGESQSGKSLSASTESRPLRINLSLGFFSEGLFALRGICGSLEFNHAWNQKNHKTGHDMKAGSKE